jgi:hypothetical protein
MDLYSGGGGVYMQQNIWFPASLFEIYALLQLVKSTVILLRYLGLQSSGLSTVCLCSLKVFFTDVNACCYLVPRLGFVCTDLQLSLQMFENSYSKYRIAFCSRIRAICSTVTLNSSSIPHLATLEVVVWAVATLAAWVVADLGVVLEVEASEVVRHQS